MELLMGISIDLPPQAYAVAILHAILEDTAMTFEELKAAAGVPVARQVLSLTCAERRDRALYSSSEEEIIRMREYVEGEPWMGLVKLVVYQLRMADTTNPAERW